MINSETIFEQAASLLRAGKSITIITVTEIEGNTPATLGGKMIVPADGAPIGTIGGGSLERNAVEYCSTRKPGHLEICQYDLEKIGMTCGGRITLLYEFFPSKSTFILFGGGHVGSALAPLLESLGYSVVILDNREQIIASHQNERPAILCNYENIGEMEKHLTAGSFFIATHNHIFDTVILRQLLQRRNGNGYKYIGMIGSRNKVRSAFQAIEELGIQIPPEVYAPVGLPIGGGSPAEIAVSIAAEVLTVIHGSKLPHMRSETGRV